MSLPNHRILESLQGLKSTFNELCKISGAPGLAIGVIHKGEILHEEYFGYRDMQNKLKIDRDTVFLIASLTKAMTAAAVGILVDQGALEWSTPVHDILPEMSKGNGLRDAKLSVVDLLSHRTGVAWGDALYLQSNNNILLPKAESIRTFDSLPIVAPPRSKYMYNNHAYNIVGLVIEKLSGKEWGDFVNEQLFQPLHMTRTFTQNPEDSNIALPYNILLDKTAFRIAQPVVSAKSMMFAGQSVRSSMGDLLRFYQSYLRAIQDLEPLNHHSAVLSQEKPTLNAGSSPPLQSKLDKSGTSPVASPIKQIANILRPHIARAVDSLFEQTYALGWNRTQLPGKLDFAWNSHFVDPFPLLGEHLPGKLVAWHGGNMPGTTSAVCLLPESSTAVVVLQNSLGLCDIADWAAQAIVDTILTGGPAHDYLDLSRESVKNGGQRMEVVREQLDKEQILGTSHRPLESYAGNYYNNIGNWVIEICVNNAGILCLKFQAREDELYVLRHYHHDIFVWNQSYDELVKRAQYCRPYTYYKFEFESSTSTHDESGQLIAHDHGSTEQQINRLRWRHDASVPEGETFMKGV